ncbi:hypothetical protein BOTBODRAFT_30614 [Botryobasidium botryosum FD-172 SS1]|uniref:Prolyl 4-hydroxylase alpha subunit Fe(2+) 2OG dioxygenase domain-containing protein n=1 Tax=Botryobasidium botryosum (strain FD-172 SS1) TaxID=930990 RepID=A0A067MXS2_BOTB1|nr:hypothetical protein BOTBODRAFT_30614 [Botryobasidium botryosum FD-172 SS1]
MPQDSGFSSGAKDMHEAVQQQLRIRDAQLDGDEEMKDSEMVDPESTQNKGDEDNEGRSGEDEDFSNDHRADLEQALSSSNLKFPGSYYFKKRYAVSEAPNPCLRISTGNIGAIGMPLSEPEARRIISHAAQAPFGMGERTIVDKEVRDTWEIDASAVTFDNPAWATFVAGVAKDACASLGVNFAVSKPKIQLYKLLVYEAGSHFLPHRDTEKVDGMFATIIIVLQSPFTGGAAHLSHAGLSTIVDFSTDSNLSTSVMAWYTDVTHEIKPITSGYRLALSYNLIHTTNALRPVLPSSDDAVVKLRRVLSSWQRSLDSAPKKIIYLLKHKYSTANLKGSALKGEDAHLVSLLESLADELGFHVGLAIVECHVSGQADDMGRHGYGGYSEADPSDLSIVEETERAMSVTNLVNLDGRSLATSIDIDDAGEDDEDGEEGHIPETIPADLRSIVEDGPPDEQEYEGYQGNYGGDLTRWYRRTVLVIWPHSNHAQVVYGDNYPQYAMDTLRSATKGKPNKGEAELRQYLLNLAPKDPKLETSILQSICELAYTRGMFNMWNEAMVVCHGETSIEKLGSAHILKALVLFGFGNMFPWIERMLQADPSNARRLKLLDQIEAERARYIGLNVGPILEKWLLAQREAVMRSLKPLAAGEGQLLVDAAKKHELLSILEQAVISHVGKSTPPKQIVAFAKSLFAEVGKQQSLFKDQSEIDLGRRLIAELMAAAIDRVDFFEPVADGLVQIPSYHLLHRRRPSPQPSPKLAELHIQACLETGNEALIETIVKKLVTPPVPSQDAEAEQRWKSVLVGLVPFFNKAVEERPAGAPRIPSVELFYTTTTPMLLDRLQKQDLTEKEVVTLAQLGFVHPEGAQLLEKTIIPKFKATPRSTTIYKVFIRQLRECTARSSRADEFSSTPALITGLIQTMISQFSPASSAATVMELLEFCCENDNVACCGDLLSRLLDNSSLTPDRINSQLIPLLASLDAFLVRRQISVTDQPFATFFRKFMFAWVQVILGHKPSNSSNQFASVTRLGSRCSCPHCSSIVRFISSSTQPSHSLPRIGAPNVRHVMQQLESAGVRAVATWDVIRTSPQGLQITKTDQIWKAQRWPLNQQQGIGLLKGITTDEARLKDVFGEVDYHLLLDRLGVPWVNAPLNNATAASTSTMPQPSMSTTAGAGPSQVRPGTHSITTVEDSPPPKRRKIQEETHEVIDLCSP